ncbi:unnamed protein product, partial [Scytosiphon promiscuus]
MITADGGVPAPTPSTGTVEPVMEPTPEPAPITPTPADVCSNGIPGIQSGSACCLAECGGCGGPGCASLGGGLGEDNCCQSEIEDEGELCSV